MLILTCRVGETIRVGGDLSVTLQSRDRGRVTVTVLAPGDTDLYFDNVSMRPSVLPSGAHSYLFSMQSIRRFRVGEVEISVWLPGDAVSLAADCEDYVHLGVLAPQSRRVSREEHDGIRFPLVDLRARAQAAPSLVWG